MSFAIPPNLTMATLRDTVSQLRERIGDVSNEATTGRHSDLTLHLSGRIGKAMISQKAITDIETERNVLGIRGGRVELVQKTLGEAQTAINGIAPKMLSALGTDHDAGVALAAKDAKAALESVLGSLNVRHGERFLFAGDATATLPFAAPDDLIADVRQIALTATDAADFEAQIDTYFNSPTGGWQQTIYAGTPTASDADSVPGTHPAITELVSGLAVLAVSGQDNNLSLLMDNKALVENAASRLASGETALTNLRADQGVIEKRIADALEALDTEEAILTQSLSKITARDQYEAATELQALQNNLEASYLLTARLSNLSLINYLR